MPHEDLPEMPLDSPPLTVIPDGSDLQTETGNDQADYVIADLKSLSE